MQRKVSRWIERIYSSLSYEKSKAKSKAHREKSSANSHPWVMRFTGSTYFCRSVLIFWKLKRGLSIPPSNISRSEKVLRLLDSFDTGWQNRDVPAETQKL